MGRTLLGRFIPGRFYLPSPYIKEGSQGRRSTQFPRGICSPLSPETSLSSSLSHVAPRRAAHEGNNSTAARRRAAEIPDPIQKIYFRNLCWIGGPGVIVEHRTCATPPEVLHVWHLLSLDEDRHDLEVGYGDDINHVRARTLNLAFGLQGYVTETFPLQHYS